VLLTLTTTNAPATDLGFLLHKHPAKVQSFDIASGVAYVWAGGVRRVIWPWLRCRVRSLVACRH
jgi:hypothetical protein